MSKKLPLPRVPAVPGVTRRQQYSAATRKSLIKAAEAAFTARGYASTSLESIVADAKVTKGALYHHFAGKQGLFEAVFGAVEDRATKQIHKAINKISDPFERSRVGLQAFLTVVQQPAYRSVVMQDGPTVLGHARYREQDEQSTVSIVGDVVAGLLGPNGLNLDDEMLRVISRVVYGALAAASDAVAEAEDTAGEVERVEAVLGLVLDGIRALIGLQPRSE